MKITVLDYSILNKSTHGERIIFDVKIIEGDYNLLNAEFTDESGTLTFLIISIGKYSAKVKNVYPVTVAIADFSALPNYKGKVFKLLEK
ncbi:MAG: hypothetical protein ACOVRN_08965 [Flavobacterium sp.]